MPIGPVIAAGTQALPALSSIGVASTIAKNALPRTAAIAQTAFRGTASRNGAALIQGMSSLGFG